MLTEQNGCRELTFENLQRRWQKSVLIAIATLTLCIGFAAVVAQMATGKLMDLTVGSVQFQVLCRGNLCIMFRVGVCSLGFGVWSFGLRA